MCILLTQHEKDIVKWMPVTIVWHRRPRTPGQTLFGKSRYTSHGPVIFRTLRKNRISN